MEFVSQSIYSRVLNLVNTESNLRIPNSYNDEKLIPIDALYELYELADRESEPLFSLRNGLNLQIDDYGTLGMAWKTCLKALDVFDRLTRYMILVTNKGTVETTESEVEYCLTLTRFPTRRGIEISNETSFVMLVNILRQVTSSHICPKIVSFQHSSKSDSKPLEQHFGCQVTFNEAGNSMIFKKEDLDVPTTKADQSIHEFLLQRMEEEKKGVEINMNHLSNQIKQLIKEALPSGIPKLNDVGRHLGMSSRTFNRRLSEKGMNFREIVNQTQQELALDLLNDSSRSIGDIAFQTGFSEQSAFNRAFKRWTGDSPASYRKSGS